MAAEVAVGQYYGMEVSVVSGGVLHLSSAHCSFSQPFQRRRPSQDCGSSRSGQTSVASPGHMYLRVSSHFGRCLLEISLCHLESSRPEGHTGTNATTASTAGTTSSSASA